jgi:hypothetical protein
MFRVIISIIILLALFAGGLAVMQSSPYIAIAWGDYEYHIQTTVLLVALILSSLALFLIRKVIFRILGVFKVADKYQRGLHYLDRAIALHASGDDEGAKSLLLNAAKYIGNTPSVLIMKMRIEQNNSHMKALFESMLSHDDTKLLGLQGLVRYHKHKGNHALANKIVARAYQLYPKNKSAIEAMLLSSLATNSHPDALKIANNNKRNLDIDKNQVFAIKLALAMEKSDQAEIFRILKRARGNLGVQQQCISWLWQQSSDERLKRNLITNYFSKHDKLFYELVSATMATNLVDFIRKKFKHNIYAKLMWSQLNINALDSETTAKVGAELNHVINTSDNAQQKASAYGMLATLYPENSLKRKEFGELAIINSSHDIISADKANDEKKWHCNKCQTKYEGWHAYCGSCHSIGSIVATSS